MKKTVSLSLAVLVFAVSRSLAQSPFSPSAPGPSATATSPPVRAQLSWDGAVTDPALPEPPPPPSDPSPRFWGSVDYLLWWTSQGRLPPLLTASAPAAGAILGPDTVVLFGGSRLDSEEHSGGRFVLGGWLNPERTFGLEVGYLFLGSRAVTFQTGSDGAPGTVAIGRPFFDAIANAENSQLVAFPGQLAGRAVVTVSTRLQGWEGLGVCNLWRTPTWQVDAMFGFRYLELNEGLGIGEDLTVLPGVPLTGGSAFRVLDQFDTNNRFYGWQFGARGELRWGNWSLSAAAKVALGDSHQVVTINGSTLIIPAAGSVLVGGLQPGGLLALSPNIGRFERDKFAVVPEATVSLGYWVTRFCRATMGYTFLYYSSGARPGDQINRVVNPSLLPLNQPAASAAGPAQPAFAFHDADFWAQGLNFGLEFRY